ncbi:hypothetical protein LWF15_34825 [Kineosporia rhizophila]|uniref:hypothetical protein n=1 Tax=Kineosporia rhizophila TaxID=84633 RepID=UPI001E4B729D|nr:hypothetical protein [Kineosporia rhizophila]MCE0540680.1 hypothetical protein [Kineosporia rhizophila]
MTGLDRRQLLRGAVALGGTAAVAGRALPTQAATATPAAGAAPAGFPSYEYIGTPFTKANLIYPPSRQEVIFPCIRGVYDKIASPLGRYYLYYAPHENPGGICLAYGNTLDGKFTEYPNNPIVSNTWLPHYDTVPHVSSPHVTWDAATRRFLLYFHGNNATTRLATSANGIDFTYHSIVLDTSDVPGSSEASYARVFEHTVAGKNNKYVMLFMVNISGVRRICWGWSGDGRTWTHSPTPLINPEPDGEPNVSGPHLLKRNGTAYVVYHGSSGNMYITDVGPNFDRETHLGVFHTPLATIPDRGRSAAPSFGTDRGVSYMFYEAGDRLNATIAVAREVSAGTA